MNKLYHFRVTLFNNARFEALTTMATKSTVFWDVTPCSDVKIHKFSQSCNVSIFSTYSTPKMKVAQKSIHSYQTRRLHIPTTREIRYSKCSSLIRKYPSVLHLYTKFSFSVYWSPCIPSSNFQVTTRLCSSKISVTTQHVASSSWIDSPVLRDLSPRLSASPSLPLYSFVSKKEFHSFHKLCFGFSTSSSPIYKEWEACCVIEFVSLRQCTSQITFTTSHDRHCTLYKLRDTGSHGEVLRVSFV
jgi:hypothetical protein